MTTGSSNDTAVSVSTFLGGAAPGNIAAGLKFNEALVMNGVEVKNIL